MIDDAPKEDLRGAPKDCAHLEGVPCVACGKLTHRLGTLCWPCFQDRWWHEVCAQQVEMLRANPVLEIRKVGTHSGHVIVLGHPDYAYCRKKIGHMRDSFGERVKASDVPDYVCEECREQLGRLLGRKGDG